MNHELKSEAMYEATYEDWEKVWDILEDERRLHQERRGPVKAFSLSLAAKAVWPEAICAVCPEIVWDYQEHHKDENDNRVHTKCDPEATG